MANIIEVLQVLGALNINFNISLNKNLIDYLNAHTEINI